MAAHDLLHWQVQRRAGFRIAASSDQIDTAGPDRVAALRHAHPGAVPVSPLTGEGMAALRNELAIRLRQLEPPTR